MGRKRVVRTKSEEIRHLEELKQRKKERNKRYSQQKNEHGEKIETIRKKARRYISSEAEHEKQNENDRIRMQIRRENMIESEYAMRNENDRIRMQIRRENMTKDQEDHQNQLDQIRMKNVRSSQNDFTRQHQRQLNTEQRHNRRTEHTLLGKGGSEIIDKAFPHSLGKMVLKCVHCSALHFMCEQVVNRGLSFSTCCNHGSTILPDEKLYPQCLQDLFKIKEYRNNIRVYNNAHAFASFNADIVNFGIHHPAPYSFVVQGQIYYQINSAMRTQNNERRSFAQLYMIDPMEAAEDRILTFQNMDPTITQTLSSVLAQINCHANAFQMMHKLYEEQQLIAHQNGSAPLQLHLHFGLKTGMDRKRYNLQQSNEIAAVFATTDDGEIPDSYVTVYDTNKKKLKSINSIDPNVDPWLYPIFFPHGTPIWNKDLKNLETNKKITRCAYAKYMIAVRKEKFNVLLHGGRLFQQWLVDIVLKIIKDRVYFLRNHQQEILRDSYNNIDDFMRKYQTQNNGTSIGSKFILPSSHIGSPRHMEQLYQDAMAIVRQTGKPDLFITMTANPKWTEIVENLLPDQTPSDRPDLVARVFNAKFKYLMELIKKGYFGALKSYVYTIEFQKRGLPHAHLLITLHSDFKFRSAEVVDKYISAQLPDKKLFPNLRQIVESHMIHGPCGVRCMNNGLCTKGFPKDFNEQTLLDEDGYASYARPNNDEHFNKHEFIADNRFVVPHCPNLLLELNSHINVEVVSTIKAVKYLYKYIFKGHDAAAIKIVDGRIEYDECESFLNSRYIGAAEAVWRILNFPLHGQSHSITRLPVHLPGEHNISFVEADNLDDLRAALDTKTMLMDYFLLNKRDSEAKQYLYSDIPENYTWKKVQDPQTGNKKYQWCKRLSHFNVIGRLYSVSPSNQELFHLRILLNHVKGSTSFEDLKTVNGWVCDTFTKACLELGLIENDQEWYKVMDEAKLSILPFQMRILFVRLLIHCQPEEPHDLWNRFKEDMSEDFAKDNPLDIAIHKAYYEISILLEKEGKTLLDFPSMNQTIISFDNDNAYNPALDLEKGEQMYSTLVNGQKVVVDAILNAIKRKQSGMDYQALYYIDGPGGSGKTFIYKTLWHILKSQRLKVQTMAFTGIAALLLPEGKTVHKTLGLPVPLYADSNSNIRSNTKQARDLIDTDVFVWDEAPMAPRYALEIMDRLLQDLMKTHSFFGGKIVLLGGDFRQLLPVRKNGTRSECISLSIKFSRLWNQFEKYSLIQNMRTNPDEADFAKYLLDIGNGNVNDTKDTFEMPQKFITKRSLVTEIYGNLIAQKKFSDVANSTILSARNVDVDEMNAEVIELLDMHTEKIYTSIDQAIGGESMQNLLTLEYLNTLSPQSLPPHLLKLRKNAVIMLIRNLSIEEGLCNGTRLLIDKLLNHCIICKILSGDKKGNIAVIHRVTIYDETIESI